MVWIWFLPWAAYLIPLAILGALGLRATIQVIVILMPQYRPVAQQFDAVTARIAVLCLRILLSAVIVALTGVLYVLVGLDSLTRGLLWAARRAAKRVPGTLIPPPPESLRRPRISVVFDRTESRW
jgi:hypothetical protein